MQRVAPDAELKLDQKGSKVNLQRKSDRGIPVEDDVKSRCGNPRCGAGYANNGGDCRGGRPQRGKAADGPFASDKSGGNRLAVRHLSHQRDGAAMRKKEMLRRGACP